MELHVGKVDVVSRRERPPTAKGGRSKGRKVHGAYGRCNDAGRAEG
jgi:hypothetical protein